MKFTSIFFTASANYIGGLPQISPLGAKNVKFTSIFFTASARNIGGLPQISPLRAKNVKFTSIFFTASAKNIRGLPFVCPEKYQISLYYARMNKKFVYLSEIVSQERET